MRWSRYFLYTLRDNTSDAEVISHQLLARAGMIDKVAAGIYTYLPLGWRSMDKLSHIIREEMNAAGSVEVVMPCIQPAELWQESGRFQKYGKELLRIKDRHDRDFCFGPTHEEVITDFVRRRVTSYRQLPANLYQIQTKFRDEIRPRFGLMRGREFLMKDAYSFHTSPDSLDEAYREMEKAYRRIFDRCKLSYTAVEADTGNIGGSESHEFMVLADTGGRRMPVRLRRQRREGRHSADCPPARVARQGAHEVRGGAHAGGQLGAGRRGVPPPRGAALHQNDDRGDRPRVRRRAGTRR